MTAEKSLRRRNRRTFAISKINITLRPVLASTKYGVFLLRSESPAASLNVESRRLHSTSIFLFYVSDVGDNDVWVVVLDHDVLTD